MNVPVQNGNLPAGFCPETLQEMLNGFSAVQFVNLNIVSGIVASATPPSDHTLAWLALDTFGRPIRVYYFAQGAWLSLHPEAPGWIKMYNQVLPDFTTFDGGDSDAVGPYSGPMWQLANTQLDGSGVQILGGTPNATTGAKGSTFPLGVGSFPSGDAVNLGDSAGEESHVLTELEMAKHTHFIANKDNGIRNSGLASTNILARNSSGSGAQTSDYDLQGTGTPATIGLTSVEGGSNGHNNLPPFTGVYFLQRTNRLFYTIIP